MKSIKSIVLMIMMVITIGSIKADDFSDAVIKAKKNLKDANHKNDEQSYLKVRGEFERILQLKKNTWLVNYYLAQTDFALSYTAMENAEALKKYTTSALELLEKVTDEKNDFAEAWILKIAINSNRFMYEPEKMNHILASITEGEEMAKKYEPENPRMFLVKALNTYYTPENFGGGPAPSKPLFESSWEKFGIYKPKDETYPDWGAELAAAMLALISISDDKMDDAKLWIDRSLEKDPEYLFTKNEVMKKYEEKLKK